MKKRAAKKKKKRRVIKIPNVQTMKVIIVTKTLRMIIKNSDHIEIVKSM